MCISTHYPTVAGGFLSDANTQSILVDTAFIGVENYLSLGALLLSYYGAELYNFYRSLKKVIMAYAYTLCSSCKL